MPQLDERMRLANSDESANLRVRKKISLLDCQFDATTKEAAYEACLEWRNDGRASRVIIPVNVAILMMMRRMPELRRAIAQSDLVVADGVPLVWASRLVGTPLPERVNGCDLMAQLLAEGGQYGLRVFFLGATEEVVTRLVEIVQERHPGLEIVGYRNGYFAEEEYPDVIRQVRQSEADVLFIGISSPFKEIWCCQYRDSLFVPTILCVGGSFDVLAGFVRRAPRWMQNAGMEWFWRFIQEPRRLWKRYLVSNSKFLWLLAGAVVSRPWNKRSGRVRLSPDPSENLGSRESPVAHVGPASQECHVSQHESPASKARMESGVADGNRWAEKIEVSLVVPCFNEEAILPRLRWVLSDLAQSLGDRYEFEFLLVDDGSTDGTSQVLRQLFGGVPNCRILGHKANRGVAAAIMTGISHARSEIVCSMDCDCTYDPIQFGQMIPLLDNGVDMVTASPYHPEGRVFNVPRHRLAMSKVASFLYRRTMRPTLYCYTSCFRVYRRSTVVDLKLKHGGFTGIPELVWHLGHRGAIVIEHPAVLSANKNRKSNMKIGSTVARHLTLMSRALMDRRFSALARTERSCQGKKNKNKISI